MKRAVVVFLEEKRELLLQFGCLYTSLKYIQCDDTDLVVFGTPAALKKVPEDCVKVIYDPIEEPVFWRENRYINSVSCLVSENASILDDYDYILKTDLDTFLTPAWNNYYPKGYTCGKGAYVNSQHVENKLKTIAINLGLRHQGIHNLGATHYGPARLVREVCGLSVTVAQHIIETEFLDGPGKWPDWYKGVTIMYSNEIAANHLVDNLKKDIENLDFDSTSNLDANLHAHIHCWHTNNMFSKFAFVNGKYDGLSEQYLHHETVRDYCLFIALLSKKRLSLSD